MSEIFISVYIGCGMLYWSWLESLINDRAPTRWVYWRSAAMAILFWPYFLVISSFQDN